MTGSWHPDHRTEVLVYLTPWLYKEANCSIKVYADDLPAHRIKALPYSCHECVTYILATDLCGSINMEPASNLYTTIHETHR